MGGFGSDGGDRGDADDGAGVDGRGNGVGDTHGMSAGYGGV